MQLTRHAAVIVFFALVSLALEAFGQSVYTPYAFTTLAGLAGSPGTNDGTGIGARFYSPVGVAVDTSGNVYVADKLNSTIRKIVSGGVVTTLAGLGGTAGSANGTNSAARFTTPSGVAVDGAGNVYVADSGNFTIRKVTAAGVVTTLAGLAGSMGTNDGSGSAARFFVPSGVALDSAANVYVADTDNNTIRKITPAGLVTTLAGLGGILNYGTNDGTGGGARFSSPTGVAVDSAGNVYVADSGNETIRKVTPAGVVTTLAGLPGNLGSTDGTGNAARFASPTGVAVDSATNVYVADAGGNLIRKVTPAGVVTTLGGDPFVSGDVDGSGSAARFYSPSGVAVDSAGKLYVGDTDNNIIRTGSVAQPSPVVFVTTGPSFGFNAGVFGFTLTGPPGQVVVLDASTNLPVWLSIATNTLDATGSWSFGSSRLSGFPYLFFRTHSP